MLSQPVSLMIQ